MRHITHDPYVSLDKGKDWIARGFWPCRWICCPDIGEPPFVAAYRKRFTLDRDEKITAHVTADERYELFVDGKRIGRGSERGDRFNWFYETYDLDLAKGEHVLVARVWSLGEMAPYAQMSVKPGFLLAAEGEFIARIGTGSSEWEAKKLDGYGFRNPSPAWGTGANLDIDGARFCWGFERGEGDGWKPVTVLHEGANGFIRNEFPRIHRLKPATLPAMMEEERRVGSVRFVGKIDTEETRQIAVQGAEHLESEAEAWNLIKNQSPVTIPANTMRRVIIDLEDYYCAYPEIVTTGGEGSMIRLLWAESLYERPSDDSGKGNRDKIEGKYFWGVGDTFRPDGSVGRGFEPLWWQAGRYLEIVVRTGDEPLTIDRMGLRETRYPLEMESHFEASDPRLAGIIPIALRGLQMCAHETYLDCPYYEQLMYSGDTRLEALATYAITRDDLLPRKALAMFDASRGTSGLTQSRYPSRWTQIIPPFSLWWVGMIYDFALWRDDLAFVRSLMPGARGVIDWHLGFQNRNGLIEAPNGWNFMDWVPAWKWGIPQDGETSVSGLLNWLFIWALATQAELEELVGEPEMAARARRLAAEFARRAVEAFWSAERNLLADDLAKAHFSEHTQCLAILSGQLSPAVREKIGAAMVADGDLARTTISFTHYLFETYRILGRMDALFERLRLWFDLEKHGFKTGFEAPEPTRSDCHGWSAHPIYHYFATILGIRPGSSGFETVKIEPQLGPLTHASGKLAHPKGMIEVDLVVEDGKLRGSIVLPDGLCGSFNHESMTTLLKPGQQKV